MRVSDAITLQVIVCLCAFQSRIHTQSSRRSCQLLPFDLCAQEQQSQKSADESEQLTGHLREARAHLEESEEHLAMEVAARKQLALQLTEASQKAESWETTCALETERLQRLLQTSEAEVCRLLLLAGCRPSLVCSLGL